MRYPKRWGYKTPVVRIDLCPRDDIEVAVKVLPAAYIIPANVLTTNECGYYAFMNFSIIVYIWNIFRLLEM